MSKTLNELSRELRDFIVDLQSDAHNRTNMNVHRYNNLKVEIVDPRSTRTPQAKIVIGISEAVFNINGGDKASGGLGPDERYVIRWIMKSGTLSDLKEAWRRAEDSVGSNKEAEKDN